MDFQMMCSLSNGTFCIRRYSCNGGSRISRSKRRGPTREFGAKTYYLARFFPPKTAWKWKKIGLRGLHMPSAPILWIRQCPDYLIGNGKEILVKKLWLCNLLRLQITFSSNFSTFTSGNFRLREKRKQKACQNILSSISRTVKEDSSVLLSLR